MITVPTYAAELGAYALDHDTGQTIEIPGAPPVTVYNRTWPKEAEQRPGVADAIAAADWAALGAALGRPSKVYASADGRVVIAAQWCRCGRPDGETYYVRYSDHGQEAHGWACVACRKVTQTG